MRKVKASAIFYFILIVMSIFLIIQTRMEITKDKVSNTTRNPFLLNNKVIEENNNNFLQAQNILYSFYDINYKKLHSDAFNYPREDFLLFYDKKDGNKLKEITLYENENIYDNFEIEEFFEIMNESFEYNNFSNNTFHSILKKGINELGLQNIKIPIVISDVGQVQFFSPFIKISKINSFETGKGFYFPKIDFSIIVPTQSINDYKKIYLKEYKVNTNDIISRKFRSSFEILDYFANIIIAKQKFYYQDNPKLSNVLAPMGGSIREDTSSDGFGTLNISSINKIGAYSDKGIISSGLVYININNFQSMDINQIDTNIPITHFIRGTQRGTIQGNSLIRGDQVEFDLRGEIQSTLNGSMYRPFNLVISNTAFESDDLKKSILLCSLNTKCGIEIGKNRYQEIISVQNVYTGEVLQKMFNIFNSSIRKCDDKYYLNGFVNPFGKEIDHPICGNTLTDILIDNSSAFNFGSGVMNSQADKLIFTLALRNDLIHGCDECSRFPFVFKKYFIYKQ